MINKLEKSFKDCFEQDILIYVPILDRTKIYSHDNVDSLTSTLEMMTSIATFDVCKTMIITIAT
jgi:hypothetical protein